MRTIVLIIGLLVLPTTAIDCHYTCQTCNSTTYTSCTTCPNNQSLSFQLTNTPIEQGVCGTITMNNVNAVGVLVLIVSVSTGAIIFNQEVIYLILFLQSLGLLYLVEVYWLPILDYVLSGLTYLMIFTRATYNYKDNAPAGVEPQICKGRLFFKQFELPSNFQTVGLADLVLFILIVFLVVFKYCRKRCLKERAQMLPDWLLDKLVLMLSTTFLLLIQQSIAAIFFSLKYGATDGTSITLIVFYFIALALFVLNHYSFPLPYFRNKFAQINTIVGKVLVPGFLLSSSSSNFLAFLFMIITWVLDLVATNKNRSPNTFNRLLAYKVLNLLCLMLLTIYYMLDIIVNSQPVSRAFGIVSTIALFGCIQLFGIEIFIAVKKSTCDEQTPKSDKKISVQRSQLKENEDLTLENIKIEQRENPQNNVFERINFDIQTSQFRRQPTTGVPYTYEQHNNEELIESKRQEQDRPSLSSERESPDVIQQTVEAMSIVVRQQHNEQQDKQKQGQPKAEIKSEIHLIQSKLGNQGEDVEGIDNREMTESNVPMKKQARKRHKKTKKSINAPE